MQIANSRSDQDKGIANSTIISGKHIKDKFKESEGEPGQDSLTAEVMVIPRLRRNFINFKQNLKANIVVFTTIRIDKMEKRHSPRLTAEFLKKSHITQTLGPFDR